MKKNTRRWNETNAVITVEETLENVRIFEFEFLCDETFAESIHSMKHVLRVLVEPHRHDRKDDSNDPQNGQFVHSYFVHFILQLDGCPAKFLWFNRRQQLPPHTTRFVHKALWSFSVWFRTCRLRLVTLCNTKQDNKNDIKKQKKMKQTPPLIGIISTSFGSSGISYKRKEKKEHKK